MIVMGMALALVVALLFVGCDADESSSTTESAASPTGVTSTTTTATAVEFSPTMRELAWEVEGTGDTTVPCTGCGDRPMVMVIHHGGAGYFAVEAVDARGEPIAGPSHYTNEGTVLNGFQRIAAAAEAIDPIVLATIVESQGAYDGTVYFWPSEREEAPVPSLAITADGPWSISAWGTTQSSTGDGVPGLVLVDEVRGEGDDVVMWNVPYCDIDHLTVEYDGSGRLMMLGWGALGNSPLLFDETEPGIYTTSEAFDTDLTTGWCDGLFMIEVRAEGAWRLTVQPAE
jgi:hypothetical protein